MNADGEQKRSTLWTSVWDWIKTIAIALLIALPIRYFIAEPFIVSGASMYPTFSSGQFLIVDRLTYRFEEPKRGDVIVFQYPNDPRVYFIKRIIGLPGETLSVKGGKVTAKSRDNPQGTEISEPYINNDRASYDEFERNLDGNEYFVMGDNRLESSDSRVWGPLDRQFIIGRPIVRLFPPLSMSLFPGKVK